MAYEIPGGEKDFEHDIADLERELEERRAALRKSDEVVVIDEVTGDEVDVKPKWSGKILTIQKKEIQVKTPAPAAIQYIGAFGMGSKGISQGVMSSFMWRHVSEFSIKQIEEWSFTGEIDAEFYDELFTKLIELGSARPTGRS